MGRILFAFGVSCLLFYIARAFLAPIAMGAVISVLFFPWLEKLESKRFSTRAGSGLLTLFITLCVLIPLSLLIFIGAKAGFQQLRAFKEGAASHVEAGGGWTDALVQSPGVQRVMSWVTEWFPVSEQELLDSARDLAHSVGVRVGDFLGGFLASLPGLAIGLAVTVVSVYFFLVDGRRLVLFVRRNTVFSPDQTENLLHTLGGTCRSVILASLVSGVAQAVLFLIPCFFIGIPNTMLIGVLVFLASFVPLVGGAPVTFGIALNTLLGGAPAAGTVLLVTAAVVAFIDNLIRPAFLRGSANLHPLLAFVAAFGGLQSMGFVGVFLGPIVAAAFVVSMEILLHPDRQSSAQN